MRFEKSRYRVSWIFFPVLLISACAAPQRVHYTIRTPIALPELTVSEAVAEIGRIIDRSGFPKSNFSVDIADLSERRSLFSLNPNRPMVTASNAKIITAATALAELGKDFRFSTKVYYHRGSVWIKGGGDPTLEILNLKELAREIASGLKDKPFNGEIHLDTSFFKEYAYIHPDFRRSGSYNTALGPLGVERNKIKISLRRESSAAGEPRSLVVRIRPDPSGFRVRVDTAPIEFTLHHKPQFEVDFNEIDRIHEITLRGPLREKRTSLAIRRPAFHFGRVFAEVARNEGLFVSEVLFDPVPAGALRILEYKSPPLYEILRAMVLGSDNFIAEMVVLALATHDGKRTREDGVAVMRRFLTERIGLPPGEFTLENGSGLSRASKFSARHFTRLLRAIERDKEIVASLTAALPTAGWSGTLRRRILDPPGLLHASAKTGMIDYASCLSGYAVGAGSRRFVFSILINDWRGLKRTASWSWLRREGEQEWRKTTDIYEKQKEVQDRIVQVLTRIRL